MDFKSEINDECAFHVKKTDGFCAQNLAAKLKKFAAQEAKPSGKALEVLKAKYDCESEICVLNQNEIKEYVGRGAIDEAIKHNFKPSGPRKTDAWLSNFEIDAVLDQVQKKYEDKKFLHIPFQMRDFMQRNTDLARLDWQAAYDEGYRTFGTIINTDYSTGSGIHWFAIFGDFLDDNEVFTIEYFNSSGELPLPEIAEWMKKFKNSLNFKKPVKDVIVTRIENQKSNTECGPFSLYYIISRLDGIPMEWFRKNRITDDLMYEFRKYLFRDEA